MNSLLQMCGSWVANTVEPGYIASLKKTYVFRESGSQCVVSGRSEHSVDTTTWTCDCRFASTLKLPCRHVCFVRRTRGNSPVIPLPYLHQRWLLRPTQAEDVSVLAVQMMLTKDDSATISDYRKRMQPRQKYTAALRLCERICGEMSELGQASFEREMSQLEQYHSSLRANKLGQLQPGQQPATHPVPRPALQSSASQPPTQV